MKVVLAADGNSLESNIAKRFGHADYYLIVDTESLSFEAVENPGHSDNHAIIQKIAERGVDMFIVGNIGPHAFEIINSLGLKVGLLRKSTAREAIDKLLSNDLEMLNGPTLKRSISHHD